MRYFVVSYLDKEVGGSGNKKSFTTDDANEIKSILASKADDVVFRRIGSTGTPSLAPDNAGLVPPAPSGSGTTKFLREDGSWSEPNAGFTASDYMTKASNLSDLANAATARDNLGLGALATLGSVGSGHITDGSVSLTKLSTLPSNTLLGNTGSGNAALSVANVKTLLALTDSNINTLIDSNLATKNYLSIASSINALADVNTSGITTGQVLQWNGTGFVPYTIPAIAGFVQTSRQVSTGTGLTGGGDLTANRTIGINFYALSNITSLTNDYQLVVFDISDPLNVVYNRTSLTTVLSSYQKEDATYAVTGSNVTYSNIATTTATITVNIGTGTKKVKRRIPIASSVTADRINLALASPEDGMEGTIFLANNSGETKQIYFPLGHYPHSGKTSPQELLNGQILECSFVANGVEVVWTWITLSTIFT